MNEEPLRNMLPSDREALMEKFGIVRVPTDVFYYRQYRYSRYEDAIAQARRDQTAESPKLAEETSE